ncbi:glutaredoxin [Wohlfahrtiimonas larvae]|uniref:Glutathione S-transferase N-terminal domain-containing protein n=1 Tax=Wohlfahrtiimonas larvae TaxID=1157986 RepID=A0ABP9MC74_9GAMM|nr:glutaredoxin [Wohlfahrtiimonas larvae]
MKVIRWILGKIILGLDKLTAPAPMIRSVEEQKKLDEATAQLKLYQFHACPFCVKVRREIRRLNLKIKLVDALNDKTAEERLINEGGKRQVPCLYIVNEDESVTWLYESNAILIYLQTLAKGE